MYLDSHDDDYIGLSKNGIKGVDLSKYSDLIINKVLQDCDLVLDKLQFVACIRDNSNISILNFEDNNLNICFVSNEFNESLGNTKLTDLLDNDNTKLFLEEAKKYPGKNVITNILSNDYSKELIVNFDEKFGKYILSFLDSKSFVNSLYYKTSSFKNEVNLIINLLRLKDLETGRHTERLGILSKYLYELLGYKIDIGKELYYGAQLHDIGKITIKDEVLNKPGKLTFDEFDIIKLHTTNGGYILDGLYKIFKNKNFFNICKNIVLFHHEKYDGSGYPKGLIGEKIPIEARIVAIIDVFDSLKSKRVYKDYYSDDKVIDIMLKGRGTHFDPEILDVFMDNFDDFVLLRDEFLDKSN